MTVNKALDLMRSGSVLIREHGERGEYYLLPGGKLDERVAKKLQDHPQVSASQDGMWPGYDQTWKIA